MSAPAIPAGYRRLKVGEKRPKGYMFCSEPNWMTGDHPGVQLCECDLQGYTYIAPVRKARKKGGMR